MKSARKSNLGCGPLLAAVCVLALAAKFVPHQSRPVSSDPAVGSEAKKAEARPEPKATTAAPAGGPSRQAPAPSAASRPGPAPVRKKPAGPAHGAVFNDPWNGTVWQVERYLKRGLYDASSFEAIEWGPVTETQKGYRVWCRYKAKNVLGVYTTQTKTFLLKKDGEVYAVKE